MIQAISQQLINEFGKNLSAMILADNPLTALSPSKIEVSVDLVPHRSTPQNSIKVHELLWQTFLTWVKGLFPNKS
jgi:uncharacterized lipoprotein YmbA